MIRYTRQYISQLLDRFMEGTSTLEEEEALSEYFRTERNVPGEWRDYQAMFAEWEEVSTPQPRRALWWWAAAAAVAVLVVAFAALPRHTGQPQKGELVAQQVDTATVMPPTTEEVPDTVAAPTAKPTVPTKRRRQPRIHDVARDYVLMARREQARAEQEVAEVLAEVEQAQQEVFHARMTAMGYVPVRLEDGSIEYRMNNEETEYYAYEPN